MESSSTKTGKGKRVLNIVGAVLSWLAKAVIFLTKKFIEYFFNIVITLLLIIIVTGGILATTFAIYIRDNIDASFDLSEYVSTLNQTSTIFYTDYEDLNRSVGVEKELGEIKSRVNRTWATIDASETSDEALIIPEHVVNAFISIEDKRFFNHNGVDWLRTGSAAISFATTFKMSYGGSTITQQLIKNLTGDDDSTIQRKLQEILRALYLERTLEEQYADYEDPKYETKKHIIETYMNTIFLSQSAYGVQAASQTYFSKDVSELTLVEAAALAAIPQNPYKWNPASHPENNKERRNTVLRRMYDQEFITEEEYRDAINTNLELNLNTSESSMNSYFVDYMIDCVAKDLAAEYGYSKEIAEQLINGGGLQIYATVDPQIQTILEEEYCNDKNFPDVGDGIVPQSAMVIIDPYTGYLLGMVGGRGEKEGSVLNRAADSKRQPGSTIKPIAVYALAIDAKLVTWGSVIDDTPLEFKGGKTPWPKNANLKYRGLTTVKYALQYSLNTLPVKILEMIKPEESFRILTEELGLTTLIESKESANGTIFSDIGLAPLALGGLTYGVQLVEFTAAYSMFPNNGVHSKCTPYTRVVDKEGNVILSNEIPEQKEVISPQTATIMNLLLQNVISSGTGASITLDKKVQVAGKTGTTSDSKDLVFIGYTPYLLAGSWYGYDTPKRIPSPGTAALKIWDKVMNRVYDECISPALKSGEAKKTFKTVGQTGGIVRANYCKDSGMIPTAACYSDLRGDRIESGYFIAGTQPKEKCTCHVSVKYDTVTKAVACENCPAENVKMVGLINIDREFPVYIAVDDAQYTWRKVGESFKYAERDDVPFYYGLRTSNLKTKDFYYGIAKDIEKPLNRICTEHLHAAPPAEEPGGDSGENGGENSGENGGENSGADGGNTNDDGSFLPGFFD